MKPKTLKCIGIIIFGVVMFGLAWAENVRLADFEESSGGYVMLHSVEALAYGIAGRWGVVGLIVALGLMLIGMGVVILCRKSEFDEFA